MPPKRVLTRDALKKSRKNLKKVFTAHEDAEDIYWLNNFLSSKTIRELISAHDVLSVPILPEQEEAGEYDLFSAIREVLDDLIAIGEHNNDASDLTDILTTPHIKGLVEAVNNISTRQYIPEAKLTKVPSVHSLKSDVYASINPSVTDINGTLLPNLNDDIYHSKNSLSFRDQSPAYLYNEEEIESSFTGDPVTMVGIPKEKGEHLGLTVGIREFDFGENGFLPRLVVERIMAGSKIEKQNLLAPGDIITEVNGTIVDSPELLQKLMKDSFGIVTLKVIPVQRTKPMVTQLYLRAFFAYDPTFDTLIPCKEAGMPFLPGDILQVLRQDDMFWWQARIVNTNDRAGLIPTEYLEERRRAHLHSARDPNEVKYKMFGFRIGTKKKEVKVDFSAQFAHEYEKSDITMYEEVARIPGFRRKVICLLGASGVGRSTVRDEILRRFPDKYACPLRDTSREKRPGEAEHKYNFIDRRVMQMEANSNRYVDFGELNVNFYGIHIRTIREIIKTGRTCLIDCGSEAARKLKTQEFMPWTLFLAAPSIDCMRAMYEYGFQMNLTEKMKSDEDFRSAIEESMETERQYRHLFDDIVVMDNMQASFEKILLKLEELETTPQWVPAKWIY